VAATVRAGQRTRDRLVPSARTRGTAPGPSGKRVHERQVGLRVPEVGGGVDHHRAVCRADEVVLLGVPMQQRRHRVRPAQRGKPRRDPFRAPCQLGREMTRVDRGPQHRQYPSLGVEIGPAPRADGPVALRQRPEEPVEFRQPVPSRLVPGAARPACARSPRSRPVSGNPRPARSRRLAPQAPRTPAASPRW
jgi:hypothetical protein